MSAGICRVQKIGGAKDIAGVQIHNRRERNHSNSNPDIDYARTIENYTLKDTELSYNRSIDKRIESGYMGKKALRKDAVRMCEILFTSDNVFFSALSNEQERAYFVDCYNFAAKRYGEDNIISAVVHKDEETPHLHLDFVPLTADGRLSAKSILGGKKELQQLQDDFFVEVSRKWGLERGNRADLDNPDEKPRKHLSVAKLKEKTALERAEKAERKAVQKEKELKAITEKVNQLLNYIPPKTSEDLSDRCHEIAQKIDEIKLPLIQKSTAQEALKAMSKQAKIAIGELDKAEQTIYALGQANTDFQKTNKKIESENENLRTENAELRQELSAARRREKAIQRLGLADVISAEVDRQARQAEEEKSRQKEKKQSRQSELSF